MSGEADGGSMEGLKASKRILHLARVLRKNVIVTEQQKQQFAML